VINMGAVCGAGAFVPDDKIPGQDTESFEILQSLKFSPREIGQLQAVFRKCDADRSHNIQLIELFA
jgi:Ca2+-binding EF-hand superfamily protein